MRDDIRIRTIGLPQQNLLIAMYEGFVPLGAAFGLPPLTADARHEWIVNALRQKMNIAAFSPAGSIMGHCFLAADEPASAEMAVFVRQESRRMGIGTALVKAILAWGSAAKLRHVWSVTSPDNRAALRLQIRCGFRLTQSFPEAVLQIDLPVRWAAHDLPQPLATDRLPGIERCFSTATLSSQIDHPPARSNY